MRKLLIAAAALALSASANAALFTETENNNTLATANVIDGYFDMSYSADIGDSSSNTSLSIPHVTIAAYAEQGGRDTFQFTVTTAGSRGIFDIDYALNGQTGQGFDANLTLFNASGTQLSFSDDANTFLGAGGSNHGYDSYIEYIFTTPGVYRIQVGSCCSNQPFSQYGGEYDYQLQVSLQNGLSAAAPEPASLALLGLGLGALAFRRRKV